MHANVRGAGKENGKVAALDGPLAGRCNGMRKNTPRKENSLSPWPGHSNEQERGKDAAARLE